MHRYTHQVIRIIVSRGASHFDDFFLKVFSHTSQTKHDCQKLLFVRRLAHSLAAVSR